MKNCRNSTIIISFNLSNVNGHQLRNGYFLVTIRATLRRPIEFQGPSVFEVIHPAKVVN